MKLTNFVKDLWDTGSVDLDRQIIPFEENDLQQAVVVLRNHYEQDILNMPGQAPAFHPEAGSWSTVFLYRVLQFILLRDTEHDTIRQHLKPYQGIQSAEAIYTVDLSFRYLPVVFNFAKGLAPDDILLHYLSDTAAYWPFSSVGLELSDTPQHNLIIEHASLKQAYIDRIIHQKDKRAMLADIKPLVQESLGLYTEMYWPELRLAIL
jgi:hypothetical protein